MYKLVIPSSLITGITQHESSLVTVGAPQHHRPVVVGVTPPASLTHSAGVHPKPSTLTAGPAHLLRVLEDRDRLAVTEPNRQAVPGKVSAVASVPLSRLVARSCLHPAHSLALHNSTVQYSTVHSLALHNITVQYSTQPCITIILNF